jgi:hypothetical protein
VLDKRAGLGAFVEDLGLAFVNAPAAIHALSSLLISESDNAETLGAQGSPRPARSREIVIAGIKSRGLGRP